MDFNNSKMNKSELRVLFKSKRQLLTPGELDRISREMCHEALRTYQLEGKTISLFLPIERHHEINTYELLERSISIGAIVALPVSNFDTGELTHLRYTESSVLQLNHYGIPEPESGERITPAQFDLVFVPLLVADKAGYRVGYGKGFYDRFLKNCSPTCKFVGLSIFEPIEQISDIHENDIQLHHVISGGIL